MTKQAEAKLYSFLAACHRAVIDYAARINEAWAIYRDRESEIDTQAEGLAQELYRAFYTNLAADAYTPSPKWLQMARTMIQNGWRRS